MSVAIVCLSLQSCFDNCKTYWRVASGIILLSFWIILHAIILLLGRYLLYSGKFGGEKFGGFTLFEHLVEKFCQIDRSAKTLLVVSTNLDGFSW